MTRRHTSRTCKHCGAFIRWATNAKTGKKIPFDLAPVDDRFCRWFIVAGRCYTGTDNYFKTNPDVERYRPHWATCPRANEARKKKRKS